MWLLSDSKPLLLVLHQSVTVARCINCAIIAQAFKVVLDALSVSDSHILQSKHTFCHLFCTGFCAICMPYFQGIFIYLRLYIIDIAILSKWHGLCTLFCKTGQSTKKEYTKTCHHHPPIPTLSISHALKRPLHRLKSA